MAVYKCKMCGGDLNVPDGKYITECEYCGSIQTVPEIDDEKKLNLFARANRLRLASEFDKAAGIYESIVSECPEESEAYWGLVLCKYGIEYVDDPITGRKIPTCHRSSFDSVMHDSDFEQAYENADAESRRLYREQAKEIEEIRKGIIDVSGREENYDVFICYKESDENGDRTLDSVLAQNVYDALVEKGYRVFFSRITLEEKLGQEFEPYIFAALNSARVMLVFGTDFEYYNAVWVKNEWSRYLKLMAKDKDKHLIPCFKDIDAYDMPEEFGRLQAQDMGKIGAVQDLLRGIEKLIGHKDVPSGYQNIAKEQVVVQQINGMNIDVFLERIRQFIKDGDWDKADEYCEKVLDQKPRSGEAIFYKMIVLFRRGKAKWNKIFKLGVRLKEVEPQISSCERSWIAAGNQLEVLRIYVNMNFVERAEYAVLYNKKILCQRYCFQGQLSGTVLVEALTISKPVAMVEMLLKNGADPNEQTRGFYDDGTAANESVLNTAVDIAKSSKIVRLLLEAGADPNKASRIYTNEKGQQTLYSPLSDSIWNAKDPGMVRLLLKAGADPNDKSLGFYDDGTPSNESMLNEAVIYAKNSEIVGLLLEAGANPNKAYRVYTVKEGLRQTFYSPLSDSIWNVEDPKMVRLLLKAGADPNEQTTGFYDNGTPMDLSMLNEAVSWAKSPEIVGILLEAGADPNRAYRLDTNEYGQFCSSPLRDAVLITENIEMVYMLVDHGADINAVTEICSSKGTERQPILHEVISRNDYKWVKIILGLGCSLKVEVSAEGKIAPIWKYPYQRKYKVSYNIIEELKEYGYKAPLFS